MSERPSGFFGMFLVKHGVIAQDQLRAAMAYQLHRNFKFGDEAVARSLLAADQLKTALLHQREHDVKIGEACIELGFLTSAEVDDVLRTQKASHVYLADALRLTGVLSADEIEKQLTKFRESSESADLMLTAESDPTGLGQVALKMAEKIVQRLGGVTMKLSDVQIGKYPNDPGLAARVSFSGPATAFLGLRCSTAIATKMAANMIFDPAPAPDMVSDVLGEIVNTLGGNASATLSRRGKEFTLSAPQIGDFPPISERDHVLLGEFVSADGPLFLTIVVS